MNTVMKKVASYILVAIVIAFTVISLLAVWDVISLENVIRKLLTSLFIIFLSSVLVLFIFAVVIKDK
ncbi:MAG: hypothetical protein HY958_11245 [Bacteroidia bacterium]|nr:hypothetical protein [Bacteroidia bacterium]